MKNIEYLKQEILNEYSSKQYINVIDLYEKNSIAIFEDYQLIGLIAFSYQVLKKYNLAIRIIENNLGIVDIKRNNINDLDLIYLVVINSLVATHNEYNAFRYAKYYFESKGNNEDIIKAYNELKNKLIKRKLNIVFWLITFSFFVVYVGNLFIKKIYGLSLLPKYGSITVAILFMVFLYLYYNSKIFDNIVDKYYSSVPTGTLGKEKK